LVLLLLLGIWWTASGDHAQQLQRYVSRSHTEDITPPTFSVKSHGFSYYKFDVPTGATDVVASGQFSTTGGPGNEVEVYLLTDAAFISWQYGYSPTMYYSSGRVTQGDVKAALPSGAGTYYLVFNNNFSPQTAKAVQAVITVHYNRWWSL
jgi:hypothetical protein